MYLHGLCKKTLLPPGIEPAC